MRDSLLPLTAFALGAMHAVGPDHLAAVGVFASRRPSWQRALGLGVRWALGHSLTIGLLGGAVVLADLRLPPAFTPVVERVVGAVLVALGAVAVVRVRGLHAHSHEHDGQRHWHLHSHADSASHAHEHRALLGIGMLHGLSGTGALVVLLPAAVGGSRVAGSVYLLSFGLGTVLAMGCLSAAAGHALHAASRPSPARQRAAALAGALASVAVGLWWLVAGGAR